MDQRHSSPSQRRVSPRPQAYRKRSNSLPIVEALGCSTPEAELILAEGRAAVNSRHAARQRRGRRIPQEYDEPSRYRPQDHLKYLNGYRYAAEEMPKPELPSSHMRTPSDSTDRSTSTVTPTSALPEAAKPVASPLWDYSSNLAKFIQTQLNSISTYSPMAYLRSGPEVPPSSKSPPQSPKRSLEPRSPTRRDLRSLETPGVLEMPPMRPPLRSAFSAWSSTDDDTGSEASPLPGTEHSKKLATSAGSNFTPSFLKYYENTSGSSFLLTSTPLEEEEEKAHPNIGDFSFPEAPQASAPASEPGSTPGSEADYPSSVSTHPQLTSSSAPSVSSASTVSYFDVKRSLTMAPKLRNRILAAVTPDYTKTKVLPAISPYEDGALANVHDIYVESRNRVRVDGMSFDMCHSSNVRTQHC